MKNLPVEPPVPPMLARLERTLPRGDYLYEPKWDGFRAVAFRDGDWAELQSRNLNRFGRYFPELIEALRALSETRVVLDGEIVIVGEEGFDFGTLLKRVHPAASRVERLRADTPATFVAFDLLALGGEDLLDASFGERRKLLERVLDGAPPALSLTPITDDPNVAADWLDRFTGLGVDGVVAKARELRYTPGKRVMVKVKPEQTADCVVAGFRVTHEGGVSSLLLGLYDGAGALRHVGVSSSFRAEQRRELLHRLRPLVTPLAGHAWEQGFGIERRPVGRLRGAAGAWTPGMTQDWIPVRPELVCEVAYDQLDRDRFRHPARFLRWRPDRSPWSCRFDRSTRTAPRSSKHSTLNCFRTFAFAGRKVSCLTTVGKTRRVRMSSGSTSRLELGEARVDDSVNPLAQPEVARLDSLEEITHWLGTFRVRLQQARATDREGIAAVVDRLEDHYRLRRAELS